MRVNTTAVAAMEAARLKTGEFGVQTHAESGLVDPTAGPMVPLVDQNALCDEAGRGSDSQDLTDKRWRKAVAAGLAPFMLTRWTPERWAQYVDDSEKYGDTLASRITVRSPAGDPFYIRAATVTSTVLANDDGTERPVSDQEIRDASPSGLGAWFTDLDGCEDPEAKSIRMCRNLQADGYFGDEHAAEMAALQKDLVDHDDAWVRDYFDRRKHWPRFVEQCDAFADRIRYRVSMTTSVAHGLTGATHHVGTITCTTLTDDDANAAAVALNQAGLTMVRPEDYFTETGDLL